MVQPPNRPLVGIGDPMPRITLRYAIEKLPEDERKRWLAVPRRVE